MAGPGLTDAYLKLNWAKHHLDALDADLETFHKSNPCRFTSEDDLRNQTHKLRVELDTVPDHIPLRCGDAFYCMRASLDQLVWRLAKLTVTIPERTQFPIIEKWDRGSLTRFNGQLCGVPPTAIAIIKELQPANGNSPESYLLWKLNAMCNLDKHRRIPVNGSEVRFDLPAGNTKSLSFKTFENYGVLSVPLAEKAKLDFYPEVSFQVNFGDLSAGVSLGPRDIRDIYEFLSNRVLPRFIPFF